MLRQARPVAAATVHTVAADPRAAIRSENFPVASRLLPMHLRRDLRSVYDVARTIDDLGDEAVGDRLALLDDFESEFVMFC
jgi:phytoene/squalene synthetase